MRRGPKIAIWLMLAVLAWAAIAALLHREPSIIESMAATSSAQPEFTDPLARYRAPYRVYRQLVQSPTAVSKGAEGWLAQDAPGLDPLDHKQHPKTLGASRSHGGRFDGDLERDADGTIRLTWQALGATHISADGRPDFSSALSAADGCKVRLAGYMTPLDDYGLVNVFLLLGSPVTCFYCQSPAPTGIVAVSVDGLGVRMVYEPVVIEGVLRLNRWDSSDFVFAIESATCRIAPR